MICIELAAKHLGMNLDGALVVVHGFGNVGLVTAKHLAKKGCKIIAVSDSTSSIDNSKVIDVNAAIDNKAKTGKVRSFPGTEPITNDELLSLKCDVLVPAAFEQVIHVGNAEKVKTRLIIEGANGPIATEAARILYDKGIFIVPDTLANASGVIVSYFEWVQGTQYFFWCEDEVNQHLTDVMVNAFAEVLEISKKRKVEMRDAAYMLAINRVAKAMMIRGIYP